MEVKNVEAVGFGSMGSGIAQIIRHDRERQR